MCYCISAELDEGNDILPGISHAAWPRQAELDSTGKRIIVQTREAHQLLFPLDGLLLTRKKASPIANGDARISHKYAKQNFKGASSGSAKAILRAT
jgi:hypothetical protein